MKNVITSISCLALIVSLGFAGPARGQSCVEFQGIDHCPVGNAVIAGSSGTGISVSGLGPQGTDGVTSRFAPTTHWQAEIEFPAGTGEEDRMHLLSISAGEVTSELFIEPEAGGTQIRASFTGDAGNSTYSVLVYNQGMLQGASGGFSSASSVPSQLVNSFSVGGSEPITESELLRIPNPIVDAILRWLRRAHFGIANNGGCDWGLEFNQAVSVTLADGTAVTGDEIRIEEDIRGSGNYPYLGFEAIETRTSVASFRITQELAEGSE